MNFENSMGGNPPNQGTSEGLRISKLRQQLGKFMRTDATLDVTWIDPGKKRLTTKTLIPSRFVGRKLIQFKCGTELTLEQIIEVK